MNVAELAKELKVTKTDVLATLKAMKLKAKGDEQEVSDAVASVIKSEIKKNGVPAAKPKKAVVKKAKEKVADKAKKASDADEKTTTKKRTLKKVVKKVVKKVKVSGSSDEKEAENPPEAVLDKNEAQKKAKKKISSEPIITLKPLARKKRKQTNADSKDSSEDAAAALDELMSAPRDVSGGNSSSASSVNEVVDQDSLPELEIKLPVTVKDFSTRIGQKPSVVLKQLMKLGIFAHINQSMEEGLVSKLINEFGFKLAVIKTQEQQLIDDHKQEEEDPSLLQNRAPVVTFMGHVDHGKTSLLDKIRKTKVADREHGGITQHMGAYSVAVERGRITFLDTPGHEAFTAMRARGAHITDLVVLVIAADEGIKPQTQEAIDHARAAGVPIIVALNKMDRENANPDMVKQQLAKIDLAPEDWGGKTVVAPVSALTGEGIDGLLEMILLESEMLELKANPDKRASGIVVEAHLSQGKGAVTTLIVQSGTLKEGNIVVVGPHYGKIKAMFDDHNRPVKSAGPSMAVEILGLSDVPEAGENFYVVEDERLARDVTFKRQEELKHEKLHARQRVSLDDLYNQLQDGAVKELNVILKADVQGSLEALRDSLEKIPSDKVRINFIHLGVGDINTSDILLAFASNAIIIAFHVAVGQKAKMELEKNPVDLREYRIIYDAVDDMRNALEGLLDPHKKKLFQSRIEVRDVFKLSKSGLVAGCYVLKGKAQRKSRLDVIRNGEIVYSGELSTLKRFKDDVREVNEGMECGISINGYDEYQVGDVIETYEEQSIAQKL